MKTTFTYCLLRYQAGNLRYYEPDFAPRAPDRAHYLAETKGLEDVTVAGKKRAAELWCENASRLTGKARSLCENIERKGHFGNFDLSFGRG